MLCSIYHIKAHLVSVVYPMAQSPPRHNLAAVHTQPHSSHVCAAQNMFTGTHTHFPYIQPTSHVNSPIDSMSYGVVLNVGHALGYGDRFHRNAWKLSTPHLLFSLIENVLELGLKGLRQENATQTLASHSTDAQIASAASSFYQKNICTEIIHQARGKQT